MIQELGVMLFKEREKMGEKQKRVADGIISISEMSKVESGKIHRQAGACSIRRRVCRHFVQGRDRAQHSGVGSRKADGADRRL